MKKDIQIIKYVLEKIEKSQESNEALELNFNQLDAYPAEKIKYHLVLLDDADLINLHIEYPGDNAEWYFVKSITWEGHDLLETLRNDKAVEMAERKAKEQGSKLDDLPIELVKSLTIASAKQMFGL
ncbi:DUF2513 domain-containing protein [Salimicrobium humidisoli]|uniref:DUF2513 domain-containing protein n=1 Tax=Salimicrobium humidisoli TaxID=2029857 RepID=UPI0013043C51|nr:DUF2513 domain-containing protein [Salimicrobium humidisoli]